MSRPASCGTGRRAAGRVCSPMAPRSTNPDEHHQPDHESLPVTIDCEDYHEQITTQVEHGPGGNNGSRVRAKNPNVVDRVTVRLRPATTRLSRIHVPLTQPTSPHRTDRTTIPGSTRRFDRPGSGCPWTATNRPVRAASRVSRPPVKPQPHVCRPTGPARSVPLRVVRARVRWIGEMVDGQLGRPGDLPVDLRAATVCGAPTLATTGCHHELLTGIHSERTMACTCDRNGYRGPNLLVRRGSEVADDVGVLSDRGVVPPERRAGHHWYEIRLTLRTA